MKHSSASFRSGVSTLMILMALGFPALFASCAAAAKTPTAVDGFIDLSGHDFARVSVVTLGGRWRLIPDRLVSIEELQDLDLPSASVSVSVPGPWREQTIRGVKGKRYGEGTYVLDVLLPENHPDLVFYKDLVHCSSRVFLNGRSLEAPPVTDPAMEGAVKANRPGYYRVPGRDNRLRVVIQVTNWWDDYGAGINSMPRLGTAQHFETEKTLNAGYEFFIMGIFLIAALHHITLYGLQRKNRALLWFALLCLAVVLRQMSATEKFLLSLAGLGYTPLLRMEHGSAYLIAALFTLYFNSVFPSRKIRPVSAALVLIGLILFALSALTPIRFFSTLVPILLLYVLAAGINGFAIIGSGIVRGESQSIMMAAGLVFLFLPSVGDVLVTMQVIFADAMMPIGLLPFVAIQSYVLAKRYTRDTIEAETLRVTASKLAEMDALKTRFLANVSHELRTPVSLIKAPLAAIMEGGYGDCVSRDHEVFSLMKKNADRLLVLIENILDLTRLQARGSLTLTPMDLTPLAGSIFSEFRELAARKGLAFVTELPPEGSAPAVAEINPRALETILFNLASNAVKYTPEGGTVTATLRRSGPPGKGTIRISVADTGIGISAEELSHVFARYRQVYDAERHHYEGIGLGLSIAQESARAMGAEISAESELGKGSAFTLTLRESPDKPMQAPPAKEFPGSAARVLESAGNDSAPPRGELTPSSPRGDPARDVPARDATVLVVEDQPDLRGFIAASLASECRIIEARDGLEAKQILEKGLLPELILSDIMMPRMDGAELLSYVRSTPRLDTVSFIFLTARSEDGERQRLLGAGGLDYIVKPFLVSDLKAKVNAVLDNRERVKRGFLSRIMHAVDEGRYRETGSAEREGEGIEALDAANLSLRENEVLTLIVEGLSDKEIADRLGISPKTASNHVASIMRKTGISGRRRLAVVFARNR